MMNQVGAAEGKGAAKQGGRRKKKKEKKKNPRPKAGLCGFRFISSAPTGPFMMDPR
jgi:hypothetical protein